VGDGEAALAALEAAWRDGAGFPLVLLDHAMAGMDGLELARRIRADERSSGVVLAMLSSGFPGLPDGDEDPLDRRLSKPVRQDDLLSLLREVAGEVVTTGPVSAPGPPESLDARVLLVEDNPANRKVAGHFLARLGCTHEVAKDGREAVEAVRRERFDLVLMDLEMPNMGGIQATRAIREWEEEAGGHVPIVALTAYASRGDEARCREAGMDGYLSKPIVERRLWAETRRVLGVRAEGSWRPARSAAPVPAVAPAPEDVSLAEVVDRERALRRCAGDEALWRALVDIFFGQEAELTGLVGEGLASGDRGRVRLGAHTLKGTLMNIGAISAADAARRRERLCDEGEPDDLREAWRALSEELARLEQGLRAAGFGPGA